MHEEFALYSESNFRRSKWFFFCNIEMRKNPIAPRRIRIKGAHTCEEVRVKGAIKTKMG